MRFGLSECPCKGATAKPVDMTEARAPEVRTIAGRDRRPRDNARPDLAPLPMQPRIERKALLLHVIEMTRRPVRVEDQVPAVARYG